MVCRYWRNLLDLQKSRRYWRFIMLGVFPCQKQRVFTQESLEWMRERFRLTPKDITHGWFPGNGHHYWDETTIEWLAGILASDLDSARVSLRIGSGSGEFGPLIGDVDSDDSDEAYPCAISWACDKPEDSSVEGSQPPEDVATILAINILSSAGNGLNSYLNTPGGPLLFSSTGLVEMFINACRDGSEGVVRVMIKAGFQMVGKYFLAACGQGHVAVAKMVLSDGSWGAAPTVWNEIGNRHAGDSTELGRMYVGALEIACTGGHLGVVRWIIDDLDVFAHLRMNAREGIISSVCHQAAAAGRREIVEWLVKKFPLETRYVSHTGHWRICKHSLEYVIWFVKSFPAVYLLSDWSQARTAAYQAGNVSVIKWITSEWGTPVTTNEPGAHCAENRATRESSSFWEACVYGHLELARYIYWEECTTESARYRVIMHGRDNILLAGSCCTHTPVVEWLIELIGVVPRILSDAVGVRGHPEKPQNGVIREKPERLTDEDLWKLVHAACMYSNLPLARKIVELTGLCGSQISNLRTAELFVECMCAGRSLPIVKWVHGFCGDLLREGLSEFVTGEASGGNVELVQWIVETFDIQWDKFINLTKIEWPVIVWLMRKFRVSAKAIIPRVSGHIAVALADIGDAWDF